MKDCIKIALAAAIGALRTGKATVLLQYLYLFPRLQSDGHSPPREENSKGKMKAMIQTMDWFAWLEADDEDEEYEEE